MNTKLSAILKTVSQAVIRSFKLVKTLFPSSHYALLSLLFIVGLELIYALQRWVIFVSITVVAIVITGIILARLEEKRAFSLEYVILPIFAATGITGFASLLSTSPTLHIYIILAGLVLFFLLKHGTRQGYPVWNWIITLVIYFLNIAFIMGLRFHLYIPVLAVLAVVFAVTGLMNWQALRRVASDTDIILPALAMAFVLAEIAWITQFLPSHYSVQTGILTTLYYVLFGLISTSFSRHLTRRDLFEYASISVAAFFIIVFSAKWV